jgi:hypothetical protein
MARNLRSSALAYGAKPALVMTPNNQFHRSVNSRLRRLLTAR